VNLYPCEEPARRPGVTFDELIEQVDVGGPSMVRAAAKNFHDVLVVVEPGQYEAVLRELDRPGGPTPAFRFALAQAAFAHTAAYDGMIARTLAGYAVRDGSFVRERAADADATSCSFDLERVLALRYGENPHQEGSSGQP